jgi:hypothetical protein
MAWDCVRGCQLLMFRCWSEVEEELGMGWRAFGSSSRIGRHTYGPAALGKSADILDLWKVFGGKGESHGMQHLW